MNVGREVADAGAMQAQLLRAIRVELDHVLRPELQSDEARNIAALASEMLAYLVVARTALPEIEVMLLRAAEPLLAVTSPVDVATAGTGVAPVSELSGNAELSAVFGQLAAGVAAALGDGAGSTAPSAVSETRLLRDAVAAERHGLAALEAAIQAELAPRANPVEQVEVPVTTARLQAYFDRHRPAQGVGRVEMVERIPGGYSKDTWRVCVSAGLGGYRKLILRRNLPFGPGENTVSDEYELLRFLHERGLPVAQPLWHEPAPDTLGTAFLLFPQLEGNAVFGDWHADPETRHRLLLELAVVMARFHAINPVATGLAPAVSPSPRAAVQAYIREWRDKWWRRRVHPSVILEVAFDWLLRHTPEGPSALSIVHGDISLRNTLIRDGQLTALLDWEFWHPGDPVEDLSYFRLVAEPYIDWDRFMAAYLEAGGCEYDPQRADFYAVWRSVRNATTTTTAWHGFLAGAYPASKAAYQGVSLYRFFLRDVAAQLERHGL